MGLLASWSNGGVGGSSKELVAQNNGKSSVYLMARNHAILSSTVGLLPRCRPSVGAGSALTLTLTHPRPNSPLEKEELIRRLCRSQGASCFRYNSRLRESIRPCARTIGACMYIHARAIESRFLIFLASPRRSAPLTCLQHA